MKKLLFFVFVFVLSSSFCWAAKDMKDEKTKPYEVKRVTKTVDGHHFLVPEDRPVEMIAGQYRPVDIDTYVAYKFGILKEEMDARFSCVDEKLATFAGQSERMIKLEQQVKELGEKVDDLLNRLEKVESEADEKARAAVEKRA